MTFLNAFICSVIAVCLFLFERKQNRYKLIYAILAWGLICSSSAVAIFTLFNQLQQVQASQTLMNVLILVCLFNTKGNVTHFIHPLFWQAKNPKHNTKVKKARSYD